MFLYSSMLKVLTNFFSHCNSICLWASVANANDLFNENVVCTIYLSAVGLRVRK